MDDTYSIYIRNHVMTLLPRLPLAVDHVIDNVYISGLRATEQAWALRALNIRHVLKLYEDIPYFPADFQTYENVIEDGQIMPAGMLKRGTDFVVQQVEAGRPVLVMCAAGISRSSTFVLSYMVRQGYDLKDSFTLLRYHHPAANPHPMMWLSLISHYQLSYSLNDVLSWK
jgi:protein-tyrosine phosphatase